ncbi:MAG: DMT family transporter [Planctomycetes bacterium]|nr:DMT family transporter [Planctomycetota bacterium]
MPYVFKEPASKGYFLAFVCSLLSAVMIVLIKWIGFQLPTLSVLLISQVMAGVFLSAIMLSRGFFGKIGKLSARAWIWLVGIVVLTFFGYWTFFVAIGLLDPTVASFVGRAETLVTIVIGMAFFSERLKGRETVGTVMVFAGVLVIRFTAEIEITTGLMICLLSALFWGVSEALAKVAVKYLEPALFTWIRSLLLIPVFFVAAKCSPQGIVLPHTPGLWIGLIGLTLSGPVLARYLYLKSLTLIPVSKAALINQFQPIWVAGLACTCLGVLPSAREWIGGVCIMAGCTLLVWKKKYTQPLGSSITKNV